MICYWYPEPAYFFFAADLPGLLYYSHVPATIIALIVGFFLFLHARNSLANQLLLLISLCFAGWTFINLITWTNIHSDVILFVWTFFGVFQALISVLSIYFIHVFLTKRDVSKRLKLVFLALLAPVLIFAHTDLHLSGFDLAQCDAFGYEGVVYLTYYTLLGVLAMVWILIMLVKHYRQAKASFKKQIVLMGIGIECFLFSFFTLTYIASILTSFDLFANSQLEFYGLFGMTIFMVMMSILIVQFKACNVGANASVALLIALIILTGSQFSYTESRTGDSITAITLIVIGLIGILLMRSIRKEIAQRKEIQDLAQNLVQANTRLRVLDAQKSEFVSIASHQLRSPLTSIRGYASMLLEGDYGRISKKAQEPLRRIAESAKNMAYSIEDYLNVSRIESGNMKYHTTDFNLRDEVEKVCDDLRQEAIHEGLVLLFRTDLKGRGIIHADVGKTTQILQNLLHNAIKYTDEGSIKVFVWDDLARQKICVDITDTGIGMDEETLHMIFQKFERARKASEINASGTGLGLYVALKMTEAMGGTITAHSDGCQQGSRFTIAFPLAW